MVLENESDVIQDATEFIYPLTNSANYDTIELYNMWVDNHGIILKKQSLVNTALSFLNNAKTLDKSILKESYDIDKNTNNVFSN